MTLKFLLDTNIVSAPMASKPSPEIVRRLEQHGQECAIGAPALHELEYGYRRLPRGRRRTALEAYIEGVVRASFPVLPYDEAAAAWHGAERARLEERGLASPYVDGQIAAIARVNGLVLVTANTKDFARFKDIDIEDWSRRRAR
ncbi:type II toxin-antitoxin system VapC family toxin [Sorangium sp. So ce513]|uniref:type II toxin-antitoxin system VapC family toxin n=1 Tax=Sorangium sp. So ce513 TaxID=3133315 RepID=UPI003F622F65